MRACACGCGRELAYNATGRPRRFATNACKQRAYRERASLAALEAPSSAAPPVPGDSGDVAFRNAKSAESAP